MGFEVQMGDGVERCTGMQTSETLHVFTVFDAQMAKENGNAEKGVAILTGLAVYGHPSAAVELAEWYASGMRDGSIVQDETRALAWYQRAADLGHVEARQIYDEALPYETQSDLERLRVFRAEITSWLDTFKHPHYEWIPNDWARADSAPPPPRPTPRPTPARQPEHRGPISTTGDLAPIPTTGQSPDAPDPQPRGSSATSEECRCYERGVADKKAGMEDWSPGTGREDCHLSGNADHWYDGHGGQTGRNPC